MKKYLPLILFLFVFASLVNAQTRWYGYTLTYNSPAYTKYVSFSMDDLGSVEIASDVHPQVATATYADGYVWSVNFDNASYTNNICKAKFNSASNLIEEPEVMVAGVPYVNDMEFNPADGLIYFISEEHLKSFHPANPSRITDHGVIENDGFNLAIDMNGNAFLISTWNNFCSLNLSNASMTVINPIDLPIKMSFDMLTGELYGVYYGNLYRIDTNTGAYTNLGPLMNEGINYDLTCLFMTYGYESTDEINVGSLCLYPNPANNILYIEGVDGQNVTVYDNMGRLVMEEQYNGCLNVGNLAQGIYTVKTDNRTVKFVKE